MAVRGSFSSYTDSDGEPRPRSAAARLGPRPAPPRPRRAPASPAGAGGVGTVSSVSRSTIGNGPIDSRPLKAHVTVTTPKIKPAIVCHRFQPRYGMLVGAPAWRKRFFGESIQMATTTPIRAVIVPIRD